MAIVFTPDSERVISAATDGLIMISSVKTGNVDNIINTGIESNLKILYMTFNLLGESLLKEPSLLLLVDEGKKIVYLSAERKVVIIELSNVEIQVKCPLTTKSIFFLMIQNFS